MHFANFAKILNFGKVVFNYLTTHNPFIKVLMKTENSGKIYLFKLDHGLGYGFAEVYDFTDISIFDGRYIYVYNKVDIVPQKKYTLDEIRSTGIALGPITSYKFPNIRGIGAWKFLFQTKNLILKKEPVTKSLRGLIIKDHDWNNLKDWYKYPYKGDLEFVPYEQLRNLETRILNSPVSSLTKFTMKLLIDSGKKISQYYDLTNQGYLFTYLELINTYYSLKMAKKLITDIPRIL